MLHTQSAWLTVVMIVEREKATVHFMLPSNTSGTLCRGALKKLNTSTKQGEAIKRCNVQSVPHLSRRFTGSKKAQCDAGLHLSASLVSKLHKSARSVCLKAAHTTPSAVHRAHLQRTSHLISVTKRMGGHLSSVPKEAGNREAK